VQHRNHRTGLSYRRLEARLLRAVVFVQNGPSGKIEGASSVAWRTNAADVRPNLSSRPGKMIVGELLMESFQSPARVVSVLEAHVLKHHQGGKRPQDSGRGPRPALVPLRLAFIAFESTQTKHPAHRTDLRATMTLPIPVAT